MEQNAYITPTADLTQNEDFGISKMPIKDILFSFQGRIPRSTFWLANMGMVVVIFTAMGIISVLLKDLSNVAAIIIFALFIPFVWSSYAIQAKRWHDRDKSAWWILIGFIPIIGGIWALVETGFLPGTPAGNRFGHPTRP